MAWICFTSNEYVKEMQAAEVQKKKDLETGNLFKQTTPMQLKHWRN